MSKRRIEVPVLTRVEGEGSLRVTIENDAVTDLRLRIFEPPRFFEEFLVGRTCEEVLDIVPRICGICPVAYQMSATHALENAFGIEVTPMIRLLRRLYYCGEWLESHSMHIHLLAAPDFLGYPDVISMARDFPREVRRGMNLQGLGNAIIRMLGGRSVNPVGARVGGFYRAPEYRETLAMLQRAKACLQDAEDLVMWVSALKFPRVERRSVCVSLRHPREYPMNEGRIVSNEGLDIPAADFNAFIEEYQMPHSTALHARLARKPYWCGPLPRLNNNLDRLPEETRVLLQRTGIAWPSYNPYHGIVARALEIHIALLEAMQALECYRVPDSPYVMAEPRAGVGMAATEAPRGLLWHRYVLDARGLVTKASIVPPTSQNQAQMEWDLRHSVVENLDMDEPQLRLRLESAIRNYDPCISCATHFLKLTLRRS